MNKNMDVGDTVNIKFSRYPNKVVVKQMYILSQGGVVTSLDTGVITKIIDKDLVYVMFEGAYPEPIYKHTIERNNRII
jgi:hypothetical protein